MSKILRYLIPIEINRGNFPTLKLLQDYNLHEEYGALVQASLQGEMAVLERELDAKQESFIQSGTFITIEKMRMICLRNFVRRVYQAVQVNEEL